MEVGEEGDPNTEAGSTIVPMLDGDLGRTSVTVQEGDPRIT
jgi:hypothetical protein